MHPQPGCATKIWGLGQIRQWDGRDPPLFAKPVARKVTRSRSHPFHPFDAANVAHPKNEESIPTNVALRIAAKVPLVGPSAGVVNEAREYFSRKATNERLEALIGAINEKTEYLNESVEGNTKAVADIQSRIESAEFAAAFREACIQTQFANGREKVRRFGAVLGASMTAEDWAETSGDLANFIQAIAQLSESDIRTLGILHSVFADVVKVYPNMHDPNPFTERQQELLRAAREHGFQLDDFYAHCRRLEGFGLAMEVLRNPSRMALGDYCFRPTRRGLRLLSLLESKASSEKGIGMTPSD